VEAALEAAVGVGKAFEAVITRRGINACQIGEVDDSSNEASEIEREKRRGKNQDKLEAIKFKQLGK
jgi:hypothetical protein